MGLRAITPAVGWVAGVLVAVFCWRVISTGLGAHFASRAQGDAQHAQIASAWSPDRSDAFLPQADAIRGDADAAAELYRAAVRANPTSALALIKLALAWQQTAEQASSAEAAAKLAVKLAPADPVVRWSAAQFWLNIKRWPEAGADFSAALAAFPRLESRLFPLFLAFGENPSTVAVLEGLVRQKSELPVWWPRFLSYAAANAVRVDTVRLLLSWTQEGGRRLGLDERRAWIGRLQSEQRWSDAYLEWINSLPSEQRASIGLLFNGGFDFPINDVGFNWRRMAPGGVRIEQLPAPESSEGAGSLRVSFDGIERGGRIIEQFMLLAPGHYRLEGRARVTRSHGPMEMPWEIFCTNQAQPLARSPSFTKIEEWNAFSVAFQIPVDCPAQRLHLIARLLPNPSQASAEKITAEVWFDAMRVVQTFTAITRK